MAERIRLVPNGVDAGRFSKPEPAVRERWRRHFNVADKTVFLFSAHNPRLKGLLPLLEAFARDGFAYQPYFESKAGEYGVSATSPEWLQRVLQRYPDIIMRAYLEESWGMQDVVILYKKAGHYEPLLGVPESPLAAPNAGKPGWLKRLLG